MRPVLEGPARGGWPTGKCPSRTGVGSLDRLDRHVRVRRVRSGWRRRRYARAGHACAPAGWPPARRAASLTRDGSGGCRCRLPAGRHLGPVAAARRAWRLLGGGAQADGPAGGGRGALFTPVVRGRSGAGFREP